MTLFSITDAIPISVSLSILGVVLWALNLAIVLRRPSRRRSEIPLYLAATVVAVGMLASAWGAAMSTGVAPFVIDRQAVVVLAGMGRGALIVGALLVMALHRARSRV